MDVVVGAELPQFAAVGDRKRVEVGVVRTHQHAIADDDRRRSHFAAGLGLPYRGALGRIHGVHVSGEVADVDPATSDGRRRLADAIGHRVFPLQRAGLQVERDELGRRHADVDHAIGDGGRRLDALSRFVGPERLERGRKGGAAQAGQRRRAAKLRPAAGRRRSRLLGGLRAAKNRERYRERERHPHSHSRRLAVPVASAGDDRPRHWTRCRGRSGVHLSANFVSGEMPSRLGPRQLSQSLPEATRPAPGVTIRMKIGRSRDGVVAAIVTRRLSCT